VSYNEDKKTPNWVSYQLNRAWMNDEGIKRPTFQRDFTVPSPPLTIVDARGIPGVSGYERGHQTGAEDRARTVLSHSLNESGQPYTILKDYYQTFLMTNVVPQFRTQGITNPWTKFEEHLRNTFVGKFNSNSGSFGGQGRELYIIAGRDGANGTLPPVQGYEVSIPSHVWKVVLIMDRPGQDISDVTNNTLAFAIDIPNDDSVTRLGTNPATGLPWSDWKNYIISINDLEAVTGYNFLSNIPPQIQEAIESNDNPYPSTP
jgi:endonuclease G